MSNWDRQTPEEGRNENTQTEAADLRKHNNYSSYAAFKDASIKMSETKLLAIYSLNNCFSHT